MNLPAEQLQWVADLIKKEIGIIYLPQNFFQLEKRLEQCVELHHLNSVWDLIQMLPNNLPIKVKETLLDLATNNETSFFRDRELFKALEEKIIPSMISPTKEFLKIWSAAASSGQEAYSIAMTLHPMIGAHTFSFSILGTDFSKRAIDKASQGIFSSIEIQRGLAPDQIALYFNKISETEYKVAPEIAAYTTFRMQNLLDSFTLLGTFDIIFCRNMLIYQNETNRMKIIENLSSALNPNGILILGASENLMGLSDQFETHHIQGILYYVKIA